MLVIAPAGTGKSESALAIQQAYGNVLALDTVTQAALEQFQDVLTDFVGVVVVDDMGRLGNDYRRISTITGLAELTYGHGLSDHTAKSTVNISNFQGSVLLNIQPVVLRKTLNSPEWEANIQDKVIRYYHLYRPVELNFETPKIDLHPKNTPLKIPDPQVGWRDIAKLIIRGEIQWGRARARQHILDLLRAAADIAERKEVSVVDIACAEELTRPLALEKILIDKKGFESERHMRTDYYYLLVEFASYGKLTVQDLVRDYKVSESTAQRFIDMYKRMWHIVSKQPSVYAPSRDTEQVLKEYS